MKTATQDYKLKIFTYFYAILKSFMVSSKIISKPYPKNLEILFETYRQSKMNKMLANN